jgi:hypothetical protein
MSLEIVYIRHRWACAYYFFVIPQIANPQILWLTPQISEVYTSPQIRKFVMVNPQIANPQKEMSDRI